MDIRDSHDLHRDICRVFAGIALHAGTAALAASGIRNTLICISLNRLKPPIPGGISASIAVNARRQFFLGWIAAKARPRMLHRESFS
jgi:hypothetical protein